MQEKVAKEHGLENMDFMEEDCPDKTRRPQGWLVPRKQVSLIAGARSLNEQDLRQSSESFNVHQASIETIRSKLVMKVFERMHEYFKRHVQYEIPLATR